MSAIGKKCPLRPVAKSSAQSSLQDCITYKCAWWNRGGDCSINVIAEMLLKDYEKLYQRSIRE